MENTEQEIKREIKRALESKKFVRFLKVLGACVVILLIFSAGVNVGFRKASFGRDWGEHYNENFGMGFPVRMDNMGRIGMINYFPNAHGATGKIIKIETPNLIVQDRDNIEKIIFMNDDTKVQKGRDIILTTDLKINDTIVVIGTPNAQGVIEAKLIRVIPSPEFLR